MIINITSTRSITFQKKSKSNKTELLQLEIAYCPMFANLAVLESKSMLQTLSGVHPNSWVKKANRARFALNKHLSFFLQLYYQF